MSWNCSKLVFPVAMVRRAMYLYCYLQLSVIDKFILGMEGIRCQQEMRFQVIPPDGGWPSGRGGGRTAHARPSPA